MARHVFEPTERQSRCGDILHDLVLGQAASGFGAFHGIAVGLVRVFGIG